MGLEDGEPICQEALNLTEKSKQKIRNVALTKHLALKDKYEFLETMDLDLINSGDDLTSEDSIVFHDTFKEVHFIKYLRKMYAFS